jgi:threonine dehydrogenase-like Zn-dependent dehydrogenase
LAAARAGQRGDPSEHLLLQFHGGGVAALLLRDAGAHHRPVALGFGAVHVVVGLLGLPVTGFSGFFEPSTDQHLPGFEVDAVGMEAHGSPFQAALLGAAGNLPGPLTRKAAETIGVDRTAAMRTAFYSVRPARTISLIDVYGGQADPFPMMDPFDKSVTIRMGQAHVERWVDEIMPALTA